MYHSGGEIDAMPWLMWLSCSEHRPIHQTVVGLIPIQSTYLVEDKKKCHVQAMFCVAETVCEVGEKDSMLLAKEEGVNINKNRPGK